MNLACVYQSASVCISSVASISHLHVSMNTVQSSALNHPHVSIDCRTSPRDSFNCWTQNRQSHYFLNSSQSPISIVIGQRFQAVVSGKCKVDQIQDRRGSRGRKLVPDYPPSRRPNQYCTPLTCHQATFVHVSRLCRPIFNIACLTSIDGTIYNLK